MPTSSSTIDSLGLPKRIADGTKGKLDFDFACGRGHSFGEYHIHGVINEILCSGIDPRQYRVCSGFAHPTLQTPGATGRKREIDFAVETLATQVHVFYAEVKWAGSSHCKRKNILHDLCRLQIIKNSEHDAQCVFVLAGLLTDIEQLFKSGILTSGTSGPLHRQSVGTRLTEGGPKKRTKNFSLLNNANHARALAKIFPELAKTLPSVPERLCTQLVCSKLSTVSAGRFQTLVWSVERTWEEHCH